MRARWKSFKIEFRFQISKQFRNQTLDFEAGGVIAARADAAAISVAAPSPPSQVRGSQMMTPI